MGRFKHHNETLISIKYRESHEMNGCQLLGKASVELINKNFAHNGEFFFLINKV
jgi:hypothetical protein